MWLWLLHTLLIFHRLSANEDVPASPPSDPQPSRTTIDTNYVIRQMAKCPAAGYYFIREPNPNGLEPSTCQLCFCQEDQTAVCWRRENRKCDEGSFTFQGLGGRHTRVRRGFSDDFFQDIAKKVVDKGGHDKECQPYESSFSEDCPPADWCEGCTVCDCNGEGRWDCHVLRFCSDKKIPSINTSSPKYVRIKQSRRNGTAKPPRRYTHSLSNMAKYKTNPIPKAQKPKSNASKKTTRNTHQTTTYELMPESTNRHNLKKIIHKKRLTVNKRAKTTNNTSEPNFSDVYDGHQHLVKIKHIDYATSTRPKALQPQIKPQVKYTEPYEYNTGFNKGYLDNLNRQDIDLKNFTHLITSIIFKQVMTRLDDILLKRFQQYNEESLKMLAKENENYFRRYNHNITQEPQQNWHSKPPSYGSNRNDMAYGNKRITKPRQLVTYSDWGLSRFKRDIPLSKSPTKSLEHATTLIKKTTQKIEYETLTILTPNSTEALTSKKMLNVNEYNLTENALASPDLIDNKNHSYSSVEITIVPVDKVERNSITVPNTNTDIKVIDLMAKDDRKIKKELEINNTIDFKDVLLDVTPKVKNINQSNYLKVNDYNLTENTLDKDYLINKYKISSGDTTVDPVEKVESNSITAPYNDTDIKVIDLMIKDDKIIEKELEKNNTSTVDFNDVLLDVDLKVKTNNHSSEWQHLKVVNNEKYKIQTDKLKCIEDTTKSLQNDIKKGGLNHNKDKGTIYGSKNKVVNSILENKYRNLTSNATVLETFSNKLKSLRYILKNLFKDYINVNETNPTNKNKTSIIRYLKYMLDRILKQSSSKNTTFTQNFTKNHILKSVCKHFGPCHVNLKDKRHLQLKANELDKETKKIMKSVENIKGLLKSIENSSISEGNKNFNDSNQLLYNILKNPDTALPKEQRSQIEFIKLNTQDFVNSVARFTTSLYEIISIVTKHNNGTTNQLQSIKKIEKPYKITEPFQGIRQLLLKFHKVQVTFMKKMYQLLNNYEHKLFGNNKKTNNDLKLNEAKLKSNHNNTSAMEHVSRNVIKNLRKLKQLANSFYNRNRRKRSIRDNDVAEYLLILMEYLLRQNHPLDTTPGYDGIDLLIEAIKNAPDVKLIKKKVLDTHVQFVPVAFTRSVTSVPPSFATVAPSVDSNTISFDNANEKVKSNEENKNDKLANEHMWFRTNEDKEDKEEDKDSDFIETEKAESISDDELKLTDRPETSPEYKTINRIEEDTIQNVFYNKFTNDEVNTADNLQKNTFTTTSNIGLRFEEDVHEANFESVDNTKENESADVKKIESTSSSSESITQLTVADLKLNVKELNEKSNQDWIEENFGFVKERDANENVIKTTSTPVTQPTSTTTTTEKPNSIEMSNEFSNSNKKKQEANLLTEKIMLRKQLDLLDSLDYATVTADVDSEDSEIKTLGEKLSEIDTYALE